VNMISSRARQGHLAVRRAIRVIGARVEQDR